ncbi:hypothetical protein HDU79_008200 [Rhizoclosmatium sp. JEL0117]|nr:hypothetical protein HDU79_008200 [Rhizoclosmatium sp. JEL0117]
MRGAFAVSKKAKLGVGAGVVMLLFVVLRLTLLRRPVCHHNSASCLIVPDDNQDAVAMPVHPTVLYYNTHGGCNQNIRGVMRSLGVKVDLFNPKQVSGYGMTASRARYLIDSGHVDFVCSKYDIIIIGDTIPHGRALLESLLEKDPMKQCRSKLVVEMTNRFDWDITDKSAYYNTISELVQLSKTSLKEKLFWVANNNVEKAWLEHKVGVSMPHVRVLRPLGVAPEYPYPLDLPEPNANDFAARAHYSSVYTVMSRKYNVPVSVFPFGHKYGGPKNLARFKAFIDIPYEYSTMKLYENIAFGIPMVIPTPRFLQELYDTGVHKLLNPYILERFPLGTDLPFAHIPEFPEWSAYMDYYAPEFEPYLYYVDSFEDLKTLSSMSPQELDFKNVRVKGPEFYTEYRKEILGGWVGLFEEMGYGYKVIPGGTVNGEGQGKVMMEFTINHIYSTKSPPATSKPLKVLYYNTHGGTTANLLSLLPLLTKPTNIHLSHFNPSQISGYGMPHSRAKSLIESGHVSWICSHSDILIIGDTTPHGRAILESLLLDPPHQCTSRKVVVELTNRFDWDVQWGQDMDAYYTLFRELVKRSERGGRLEGRIEFVANNLAEGRWIEGRIGVSMEGRVRIVRPLGIVKGGGYEYPNDLPPQNKSLVATQRHKSNIHSYLLHELNLSGSLALFPFGHKYGGPQNLLKFKAFLEIPYQFSTMKFYENIASGVPQLIPTPRFLLELYYSGLHGLPIWDPAYSLATLDPGLLTNRYSLEWAKYVDYYAPEFEPGLFYLAARVADLHSKAANAGPGNARPPTNFTDATTGAPKASCAFDSSKGLARLEPAITNKLLAGYSLDWSYEVPRTLESKMDGISAPVFNAFMQIRYNYTVTNDFNGYAFDYNTLNWFGSECGKTGAMLLFTLEPDEGFDGLTDVHYAQVADALTMINQKYSVPVLLRFAHEMNGNWCLYCLKPTAFKDNFRRMANLIRARTNMTAMVWGPNVGIAYPFSDVRPDIPTPTAANNPDFAILDTNANGIIDPLDDPYTPFYPGDDVVDWVALSVYNYPLKGCYNCAVPPTFFHDYLTGTGDVLQYVVGNDWNNPAFAKVHDFYAMFSADTVHQKPLMIPESGAPYGPLWTANQAGATKPVVDENTIKAGWWNQILSQTTLQSYPKLKLVTNYEDQKVQDVFQTNQPTIQDWKVTNTSSQLSMWKPLIKGFSAYLPQSKDLKYGCDGSVTLS